MSPESSHSPAGSGSVAASAAAYGLQGAALPAHLVQLPLSGSDLHDPWLSISGVGARGVWRAGSVASASSSANRSSANLLLLRNRMARAEGLASAAAADAGAVAASAAAAAVSAAVAQQQAAATAAAGRASVAAAAARRLMAEELAAAAARRSSRVGADVSRSRSDRRGGGRLDAFPATPTRPPVTLGPACTPRHACASLASA